MHNNSTCNLCIKIDPTSFVSHTEYSYTTNITEKSDVYSYGVVLLEILSGRAAIERAQPSAGTDVGVHIVEWAKKKMGSLEPAVTLLDPRLRGMPDQIIQEMLQTLGIAMFCVNPSPGERPTMKEVVALLKEVKSPTPEEWGKVSQPLIKGSNNG
jgi:serine/threonine protein kinase